MVDAIGLGPIGRKVMGVRVPSCAQEAIFVGGARRGGGRGERFIRTLPAKFEAA